MAEKLDMKSMDMTQQNIAKIQALFPNAVTEVKKDGQTTLAVDFDVLKQELSAVVIDDKQERYQMTWPDKKKAMLLANSPINATLRPRKEESVDFDNTQNLYIEGDNLDVLKLLRETYLGKVKMIYIDPPYNTGNDFVYNDDFAQSSEEYLSNSGQYDEQGNRLVKNLDNNGRFHTDWLNMIYPRLKVAKDLLTDDGVIFISIDDNEQGNLKKICDEIFGFNNTEQYIWCLQDKTEGSFVKTAGLTVRKEHEYIIACFKSPNTRFNRYKGVRSFSDGSFSNPDNDPRGDWFSGNISRNGIKSTTGSKYYTITNPAGESFTRNWTLSKDEYEEALRDNRIFFAKEGAGVPRLKIFQNESIEIIQSSLFNDVHTSTTGKNQIKELFDDIIMFNFPKPVDLLRRILDVSTRHDSIVIDFFSGSSTTAHAVMQLNAEDGGNRKFIMVQLPEECDAKSEAAKAGYKNICEIGKERIRRAGKKIKEENGEKAANLDTGFRVLKLDSSNMQDVYYNPNQFTQSLLDLTVDNIKPDRTPLDLLFQVMIDLGVELSAMIEQKVVNNKTCFMVNGNDIVACFDDNIHNQVITEIAKMQPLYAVFKDRSFANDSTGINNEQLFKTYSPATKIKVI